MLRIQHRPSGDDKIVKVRDQSRIAEDKYPSGAMQVLNRSNLPEIASARSFRRGDRVFEVFEELVFRVQRNEAGARVFDVEDHEQ